MSDEWFPVRKKPIEVRARGPVEERETIDTREGTVVAEPGDFIIKGVEGEVYPIAADIFEETYERIQDSGLNSAEDDNQ